MHTLRYFFGPSGSGKSTIAYQELIQRAIQEPNRNFLVIVPDQYTMQTQKTLSLMSERGGILNIDVLSFGRLTHRILEEVGLDELPVLDDTGKCLILQQVAAQVEEKMPVLGRRLHKQGYIHEAKSALSEFMQYGIDPEALGKLVEASSGRGALHAKLQDLQVLYQAFRAYLQGKYITTEEKLDLLRQAMPKSRILPGSVVLFDGFTGFTPIQLQVIVDLMLLVDETILTLVLGEDEAIDTPAGEQDLFYLSRKTYSDLCKLAQKTGVERGRDVYCNWKKEVPALVKLEQELFRYGKRGSVEQDGIERASFEQAQELQIPERVWMQPIQLSEMTNPAQEVHQVGLEICRLIREEGYQYRNIAVITGDLSTYAPYVEREFASMGIPIFLDQTSGVRLNPLVETIRSGLNLQLQGYSREAMFHYLRSGLAPISADEVDRLEQYANAVGIKGFKAWNQLFCKKASYMNQEQEEELVHMNELREKVMEQILILHGKRKDTAKNYVNHVYDFLLSLQASEKMQDYEAYFAQANEKKREREYAQIYNLVIQLLEQIYDLTGDDQISLQEFYEILEAGIGEIRVGSVPQNVDRTLVGDMERTRVGKVQALFMLGVNDGNIPKSGASGGILSDLDREFLLEEGFELAPTPRQEMYTQRLYLYLNMTKPMQRLYLSYSNLDMSGKSIRASYLVGVIRNMFPWIKLQYPENRSALEKVVTPQEGLRYLAEGLREFLVKEDVESEELLQLMSLLTVYEKLQDARSAQLEQAAFASYVEPKLTAEAAATIYGKLLSTSVSRLESYSKCAYQFFLRYGLGLQEQREFAVDSLDKGNVLHDVIKRFHNQLEKDHLSWKEFSEAYARDKLAKLLEESTTSYGSGVYYDNARSRYSIRNLEQILVRTILTLQKHLQAGDFEPIGSEIPFRQKFSEQLQLRGIIDRVDLVREADRILVKIIDYKSGKKELDLNATLSGEQVQLPLYMGQELEEMQKEGTAFPAALLYYTMDDPMLDETGSTSDATFLEKLQSEIDKELRMRGFVSTDQGVLQQLDHVFQGMEGGSKSTIIPVELKKDGSFGANAKVLTPEEMEILVKFARQLVQEKGRDILAGKIPLSPAEGNTCEYCPFRKSCGFDARIPGCEKRKTEKKGAQEVLGEMEARLHGN